MVFIGSQLLAGCSHFVSKAANSFGDNLSRAMLNQDDPELVRAGMPSYVLLMDSFVQNEENDPSMLASAATLYASYGSVFAEAPRRARLLTKRGREYASQAMCQSVAESCRWRDIPYDEFEASLARVGPSHADLLYTYGFTNLAYIRAHSDDWNALAELPQAEAVMQHYIDISGENTEASAHNYIGILMTIRPPSLGGKQDEARQHFNTAIELSGGKDLGPKVEMLKGIARMLYDRELNDQLCAEILGASPYADGYTLTNILAQEEALALCSEADNYF
jgi:hypothetical protein